MNAREHAFQKLPAELLSRWQDGIDLLAELGGIAAVSVACVDGNRMETTLVSRGGERWLAAGTHRVLGEGCYCDDVVRTGGRVHVPDARLVPDHERAIRMAGGLVSYLGNPLRWPDGTLFGTLCALDARANEFSGLFRRLFEQTVRAMEAELAVLDDNARLRREIDARRATERALRATEQLHNEAQRIAQLGHWQHDLRTGELTWSDEMFRIYEIDRYRFRASYDAFIELVHPADRQLLLDAFARAVADRIPFSLDYRLLMPDGRVKWMSARASITYSADGSPLVSTGTTQDVTRLMEAKLALEASEALHERAQEIARLGHWRFDLVAGVLSWSDQIYRILELDQSRFQISYEKFLELVHPDDRAMLDREYSASLTERRDYRCEHRLLMPDGRIKWLMERGITSFADDGTPLVTFGTTQDITSRKEAEYEREMLSRIVSELGELIFIADTDGNVIYINDACRRLIAPDGITLPVKAVDILVPEEYSLFTDVIVPRLLAGDTWQGEHTYRVFGSDKRVSASVQAFGMRDPASGAVTHFVNVSLDITERKAQERERAEFERHLLHVQKLESLGVMAGGIAHDFNNILQAIIGNLDLAGPERTTDRANREALIRARQAAVRAADITRQLLTFAGRDIQPQQRLDLGQMMEEAASLMRTVIDKRIQLRVLPPPCALAIDAVPGQIQQVLMNLVSNAADAIADGKGTVTLSCGRSSMNSPELARIRQAADIPAADMAWVEVQDTGHGMDEKTVARLFDPFFTTKAKGRGLGMPSVLGILRAHRGTITVDSVPGHGTTMRVLLPCAIHEVEKPVTPTERPGTAARAGKVLLVDDDESIRVVGSALLQRRGFNVICAASGQDALTLIEQDAGQYECVVLDLTMPGVDGADVYHFLRERHPSLPVLLSSGYDYAEALRRIKTSESTAFIRKPWRGEDLYKALSTLLRREV